MLDPERLYQRVADAEDLGHPVLLQALTGFVDAGSATRLAREHLLATLGGKPVATFEIDQLLDYRSRRPMMDFAEDHWAGYDEPALALYLLHDRDGAPFLLLAGPEPDLSWERFVEAMLGLIRTLNVRLTVGLNAIPMAVPHTRPTGVTAHATRRDLIAGFESWTQRVRVPASVGNLLEYRLGQHGLDAIGFAVHVPHYIASSEYPAAAETLLTHVSRATGLLLPVEELRAAGDGVRQSIDAQVAASPEAGALVTALEEQYDAFLRGREGTNLLARTGPLPNADELGAELERFLAQRAEPDDPGTAAQE